MKQILYRLYAFLFFSAIVMVADAQIRGGEIVRIKNIGTGKYMVPENSNSPSGAQMTVAALRNEARFNWRVVALQSGGYQFFNQQNNMVLCIKGESKDQNAEVIQLAGNLPNSTGWLLVRTTRGFKMKNRASQKLAAIPPGSNDVNPKLVQLLDNATPEMEWQFEIAASGAATATGKKVLFDVNLNYIAVSEATRNRIDNGDCRRVFGQVSTELWELDDDNEMKTRIRSYNNMPEVIYQQSNYTNPPTAGLSYYQDNLSGNTSAGKVTYNIPEDLLKKRKVMLIVKTNIGSRHKDNDFASYDALRMKQETQSTYILDTRVARTETIQSITDLSALSEDMHLTGYSIPANYFQRTDDTHKIWVKLSFKKN